MEFSKDDDFNEVRNYSVSDFLSNGNDANYVYRMFECHYLFKKKDKINFVANVLGLDDFKIYPDKEELNALIKRGKDIIKDAAKDLDTARHLLEQEKSLLASILNGQVVAQFGFTAKELASQQKTKIERAENKCADAEFKVHCRKGLLGMIRPMVTHMLNVERIKLPVGILSDMPSEDLPDATYKDKLMSNVSIDSHKFAWGKLTKFVSSVEGIYQQCNPPSDKYSLCNGGKYRYKHCRFYYGIEGRSLRQSLKLDEYADYMAQLEQSKEQKQNVLNKSL